MNIEEIVCWAIGEGEEALGSTGVGFGVVDLMAAVQLLAIVVREG